MAKSKKKAEAVSSDEQVVSVPNDAIYYIVSNYFEKQATNLGSPVIIGVTAQTVEDIIGLFIDWASQKGYVNNGILVIGGKK